MSEHEYQRISHVLHTAFKAAKDNNIYWDLEEGERASAVRKSFLYVAKKENLNISIRRVRGEHSLAIHFLETKAKPTLRIAAEESRRRIIKLLAQARKPLKRVKLSAKPKLPHPPGICGLRNWSTLESLNGTATDGTPPTLWPSPRYKVER